MKYPVIHRINLSCDRVRNWRAAFPEILLLLMVFPGMIRGDTAMEWQRELQPANQRWQNTVQHLLMNNDTEPETIDPALITGVPESRIVSMLFEGLVNLDPKTLAPRPGVAHSWQISADGLIYTFNLRPEAKWSNGDPLTAMDFYRSWERLLTPATGAAYAYQLFPIAGAEEYYRGKLATFQETGIRVINPLTLEVRLSRPCHYFLDLAAFHALFPVPIALIRQHGDQWVNPEHLVSNGAYKLQKWEPRQKIEVIRNEHYWQHALCKLDKITIFPYDDQDTVYKLFRNGQLHWVPSIPLSKRDEIQRQAEYYVSPYIGTYFYRYNVTQPPFDDKRVRRALSLAIDRTVITDQVLQCGQEPATWFCPAIAGYQPITGLAYNPEEARRLLLSAGFDEHHQPFPVVEILYNTSDSHKRIAETIAYQWKRNLNIQVELRNTEWKVLLNDMDQLSYQIVRSSWVGDYLDPNTFFDLWQTGGGNNRTGWSNPNYDRLLEQSRIELDRDKRFQSFQQMERILVEDEFPLIPLYIYVSQGMLSPKVKGWHENIRDLHPIMYIWLED